MAHLRVLVHISIEGVDGGPLLGACGGCFVVF